MSIYQNQCLILILNILWISICLIHLFLICEITMTDMLSKNKTVTIAITIKTVLGLALFSNQLLCFCRKYCRIYCCVITQIVLLCSWLLLFEILPLPTSPNSLCVLYAWFLIIYPLLSLFTSYHTIIRSLLHYQLQNHPKI